MSFDKKGRRTGKVWDNIFTLDNIISNQNYIITAKNEKGYEYNLSGALSTRRNEFSGVVISEIDKETKIESVYCFGKKHRPDMAIGKDGIVIELKYISNNNIDGIKQAIGQSIFYRLKYKFGVIVLVLSKDNKDLYEDIVANERETDLEGILKYLADELNIFTYIIPAFKTGVAIKKIYKSLTIDEKA